MGSLVRASELAKREDAGPGPWPGCPESPTSCSLTRSWPGGCLLHSGVWVVVDLWAVSYIGQSQMPSRSALCRGSGCQANRCRQSRY